MIVGTGIDIVHVKRLELWGAALCERWFHPEELDTARSRGRGMSLSLAARFAAKEAFGKALGTGLKGIALRDIQVVNSHNGRPSMVLHGTALRALEVLGSDCRVHLSLTHDEGNAVAMVIIEREGAQDGTRT